MIDFQNYIASIDSKMIAKPFDNSADCQKYIQQLIKDAKEREGVLFVALNGNTIIGFIQGVIDRHKEDVIYTLSHRAGDHGWIGELYVNAMYRGQGIAKQLVEKISAYFKERGCDNVRLNAMAENKTALIAYKKMGFELRNVELVKYSL